MSENILINHGWRFQRAPSPAPGSKVKAGMYFSAKTQCLRWGPGTFHLDDHPEYGSWDKDFPEHEWEIVDLPHDYIISQTPDPTENAATGFFKYECAWYRKHFKLAPEDQGKRIAIYFEGITGISDIYLNGCFLRHSSSGYDSFEVDITDLARFNEENVLSVHVDPNSYETWWYAGGGIYRNVWLCKSAPVAIPRWGVFLPVQKLNDSLWKVPVEIEVRNIGYTDIPVTAKGEIFSPDCQKVGEVLLAGIAQARNTVILHGETTIENPLLWDINAPKQYTLQVSLATIEDEEDPSNPVFCDSYTQKFGFRTIDWSASQGIFLNGRPIKLKGVCGHLDCGLTGKAVPNNLCRYKMQMVKEMGANAVRTSHYPHQEAVMDACDELGLLVMDENRHFASNEDALGRMERMVRRDRNRPSVFLWSTGNEESEYFELPQGIKIHKALEFVAHKLDPTRMVTTAVNQAGSATITPALEVIGVNYSLGALDAIHEKFPDRPIFASECCAVGSTRGWYYGDNPDRGYLDARDRWYTPEYKEFAGRERYWKVVMERPWHAGEFQWDAFEHRGEAVWPRLCSVSGAIDMFLQRKDAFYQNQSHWLEKPMIHVLPHWNHRGLEGEPMNVWCYTNCEEAELFLNGQSAGRKPVTKWTHLEWDVPYTPGRLEVIGYINGQQAVTDCQVTTGAPYTLRLTLQNGPVAFNGEEIAIFTCAAYDAEGLPVPDADPMVQFDCIGDAHIVGTGSSITDHVPVPSVDRKMYAGLISIVVKYHEVTADKVPHVTLYARACGLKTAVFRI